MIYSILFHSVSFLVLYILLPRPLPHSLSLLLSLSLGFSETVFRCLSLSLLTFPLSFNYVFLRKLLLYFQLLGCGGEGGPGDAEADVHPPGQPGHRRAVDAEGRLLPQAQGHQQHGRQARICEYFSYMFFC